MSNGYYERGWTIPLDLEKYGFERCPIGCFLVCGVCADFDGKKRLCGLVPYHSQFWFSSFRDHVNSQRHKTNCITKAVKSLRQEPINKTGHIVKKINKYVSKYVSK